MSSTSFFFSSRRRHTRFDCDWSSDVCSSDLGNALGEHLAVARAEPAQAAAGWPMSGAPPRPAPHVPGGRSEEHTSELQSQSNLVCRLLLEKKKEKTFTQSVNLQR